MSYKLTFVLEGEEQPTDRGLGHRDDLVRITVPIDPHNGWHLAKHVTDAVAMLGQPAQAEDEEEEQ